MTYGVAVGCPGSATLTPCGVYGVDDGSVRKVAPAILGVEGPAGVDSTADEPLLALWSRAILLPRTDSLSFVVNTPATSRNPSAESSLQSGPSGDKAFGGNSLGPGVLMMSIVSPTM